MVKSNLKEEERLVEEIPKFSYLNDKSNKGYIYKNASDGDYLSIKMAITKKDPILLK